MPGEFFGEEELIENSDRKFSVLCIHPGSLYSINKKEFFRRILNDSYSKTHLLKELEEKRKWRGSRLREYIFSHSKTNTFLKELAGHKTLLQDFSISEMDLLLQTEDLGDREIFPNGISTYQQNEEKNKLKLKISNIMSQSQVLKADFFLVGMPKKPTLKAGMSQPNQTLYDYFMNAQKKRFLNGDFEKMKKIAKNKKEKKNIVAGTTNIFQENQEKEGNIVTLPVLADSPLKKIKEKMHLFLDLPPESTKRSNHNNNFNIDKKPGFLSDRREYYSRKPKTFDFTINLLKKATKISEFQENTVVTENLPLKYRSQEIYQKILERNKKNGRFREKSSIISTNSSNSLGLKLSN